jgi:hypothetical protein
MGFFVGAAVEAAMVLFVLAFLGFPVVGFDLSL